MSDEESKEQLKKYAADMRVPTGRLAHFLDRHTSDMGCLACGGEEFVIVSDNGEALVFNNEAYGPRGEMVAPSYVVSCVRCGWMRHHMMATVLDRLREIDEEEKIDGRSSKD